MGERGGFMELFFGFSAIVPSPKEESRVGELDALGGR
jgi:hypothetical protein